MSGLTVVVHIDLLEERLIEETAHIRVRRRIGCVAVLGKLQRACGADRSSGHFDTKQDAVDAGRQISQNQGTEFVVHNKDGKIAGKDSHGNDPNPPKG